jgi:ribosome modulation factor
MAEEDDKFKTGFEYKKLETKDTTKDIPLEKEEDDIELAPEKPAAMLYGKPAQLKSKPHPLYKNGKMAMSYKTPAGKMLGDLDKDGKMSGWEQARQDKINKNLSPGTYAGDKKPYKPIKEQATDRVSKAEREAQAAGLKGETKDAYIKAMSPTNK